MKKGFAHIILIAVLAATLAIFGFVYFKSLQTTPYTNPNPAHTSTSTATQSATKNSSDTESWRTYKDSKNRLEFQYPGNFKVEQLDENTIRLTSDKSTKKGDNTVPNFAMVISLKENKNDYISSGNSMKARLVDAISTDVAGMKAITISGRAGPGADLSTFTFFKYKDGSITVAFYQQEDQMTLYNQILATFQFLN